MSRLSEPWGGLRVVYVSADGGPSKASREGQPGHPVYQNFDLVRRRPHRLRSLPTGPSRAWSAPIQVPRSRTRSLSRALGVVPRPPSTRAALRATEAAHPGSRSHGRSHPPLQPSHGRRIRGVGPSDQPRAAADTSVFTESAIRPRWARRSSRGSSAHWRSKERSRPLPKTRRSARFPSSIARCRP